MRFIIFAAMLQSSNYISVLLVYLLSVFSSCSHTTRLSTEQIEKLRTHTTGNWISSEWLDAVHEKGSPAGVRNISCMEIMVSAKLDSLAWIEPGKELMVYPLSLQSDSSFVLNKPGSSITFYYAADLKTMFMHDGSHTTRLKQLPLRYAVISLRGWKSGLTLFMNEDLIAGEYLLIDEVAEEHTPCIFTSYGEVRGLAGYKVYKLCLAGSCLEQSEEDVITLSDEKSADRYIWNWENDTLKLYSVRNTGTLEQPVLKPHEVMFRLIKK